MTASLLPTPTPGATPTDPADAPTDVRRPALPARSPVPVGVPARGDLAPGAYLIVPEGDEAVAIRLGPVTRIGRRSTSDIVVDHSTVSRRHALVLERGGDVVILDDRSLNGIRVNGRRVREARLRDGDEVQIGDRVMRFLLA